jgi:hypothetical protein
MSFGHLRPRLLLLVLLAVLPALVLIVYTSVEHRREATERAQAEALRLARLAAADQERAIDNTRQLLAVLAQLPVVRSGDPDACGAFLAGLLREYPLYANLGVIEPHGIISCSALPTEGTVSVADRTYFRQAVETRDFATGDYQIGRITGKPTLNFGLPVLDAGGEVEWVVFASLDLAWLNEFAAEAQLPEGSTLTVVDRFGTVLVYFPDPDQWVGRSFAREPVGRLMATPGERLSEAEGADGVDRLYAVTPLGAGEPAAGARLSVGIPVEAVVGEADRALVRNLVWLGLVTALALLAAWFGSEVFVLRRVEAVTRAMRRLRAGDLSARTGLRYGYGELDQLARGFDELAASLERREEQVEPKEE